MLDKMYRERNTKEERESNSNFVTTLGLKRILADIGELANIKMGDWTAYS